MKLHVLKFGGTSMGSADAMMGSAAIVAGQLKNNIQCVVVVSAVSSVTDELIALVELAKKQKQRLIAGRLNRLENLHKEMLEKFVPGESLDLMWEKEFVPPFKQLRVVLTGISLVGELTKKTYAFICSFGELISSRLMANALRHAGVNARPVHSKRLIRTNSSYLEAEVDLKRTRESLRRILPPLIGEHAVPVVMGFTGKDTHGNITLLGRGGSDYTASLLGIGLDADEVQIWTDVDGVMSADPRIIPHVKLWSEINIDIMAEMASSGAKVLHPKTITAAVYKNIPVYIKNTFNPSAPGTLVMSGSKKGLKGVQSVPGQMLIHLKTPEMLHAFGFIQKCSQTFVNHNVSIDVCATSEISFTCSIGKKDYSLKLHKALSQIAHVETIDRMAKICVIGTKVSRNPQLISQIFAGLAAYEIYTVSIGASTHNITFFVEEKYADPVLRTLHANLFE